jgi:hypothetical protein
MSPCLLAGPVNAGTTLFRIVIASLKGELIDLQAWTTKAAARRAIVEYTGWYNGTRLHRTPRIPQPRRIRRRQDQEGSLNKPSTLPVKAGQSEIIRSSSRIHSTVSGRRYAAGAPG